MSLNTGLTAIPEEDIAKHLTVAQSFVTKLVVLENDSGSSGTALRLDVGPGGVHVGGRFR